MYVDNELEDYTPPEYSPGTLAMRTSVWKEDHTVKVIHVTWGFREDSPLNDYGCFAAINDTLPETSSLQEDDHANSANDECTVNFLMPNYMPSSTYSVNFIRMQDAGLNYASVTFTGDEIGEAPAMIELVTTNPDTEPPEIDVNRIFVDATPTNPEAPNGETEVTIRFWHRDNISGLRRVEMYLRDPQGGTHHHWISPDDRDELYPSGDPKDWQIHEAVIILPPGSVPGTWGIAELWIEDRARNFETYNFVEIVHFDVDGG